MRPLEVGGVDLGDVDVFERLAQSAGLVHAW